MKQLAAFKILSFIVVFGFLAGADAQPFTGTYTIPGTINSTAVNNLTQLSELLNAGTVSGTAIFEFTSAYNTSTDTFPIAFNQFAGGGNVIIRPASSVTTPLVTSGNPGKLALIYLYGVKNLSFDGRPGGTGNRIQWIFQNTGSASSYPAFRFVNGASADTLQYLAIQSSTAVSSSTILFDTCHIAGGNSNNVIQYDSIGNYSALPFNAILSVGTKGANANSGNTIANNNIYNFQGALNGLYNSIIVPTTNGGVIITQAGNGSNWDISNNSIYSTDTTPQVSSFITGIYFGPGPGSSGNIISGNYIGGKAPLCGTAGNPWIFNGLRMYTTFNDFTGIYVYADTGGLTTVSNNTVQNIRLLSQYGSGTFAGIHIGNGRVNVTGNTIGHPTAYNSLNVGACGEMLGIWNESAGKVTIDRNTVANMVSDFSAQPVSQTPSGLAGIYCYTAYDKTWKLGPNTITNNSLYNLSATNDNNFNQYFPINDGGGGMGVYETVWNMHVVTGIYLESSGNGAQVISKNSIYNLKDTVPGQSLTAYLDGMVVNAAGNATINGNLIYGLWTNDAFGAAINGNREFSGITGLLLPGSAQSRYFVTNNMIQLGIKPTDSSSVINSVITGIWDNNASNSTATLKSYIYHNSIYIGGTDNNSHKYNLNSYAFRRDLSFSSAAYDSLNIKNNIFVNNRSSSGGTGINYGIFLNDTTDVSSDYNLIYGTGTNYNFGSAEGESFASAILYQQANSGYEANSITNDPQFANTTSTKPDLHVQSGSPVDMAGTAANTIVYDFDSLIRANYSPVDIGAAVVGGCVTVAPTVTITPSATNICPGNTVYFTATGTNTGTLPTYNFYVDGASQQNSTSNAYSTSALGNGDSVWVVITSNLPCVSPASAISSPVYITTGTTIIHLTDSVCANIPYYFNNRLIDTSGTYYDTLLSQQCDTILELSLFVGTNPLIAQLGSDTLTVTSFNYQSYQWLLNDTALLNANLQFYITKVSGLYRVVVISSSLCTDTSVVYVYVSSGVNDLAGSSSLSLYPNPTNNELHLSIDAEDAGIVTIRLFDLYGQQVMAEHRQIVSGNYNTTMSVRELPTGIYLLSVQSGQNTYNRKVEIIR